MAVLLNTYTGNQPLSATDLNDDNTQIENSFADLGPWVVSGLVQSAGTGLAVNVTAGVASIGGRVTVAAGFTIPGLTISTTNYLYLLQAGTGTSNTTGTAPANSVRLGTATTDGSGVTAVNVLRSSGRQTLVRPENQVAGNVGSMGSIDLSDWNATAGDGWQVFGSLPGGALPANVFLKDSDQTLSEGTDVTVGTVTGTKIGTGATEKLGFFGATPIVRPGSTTDLRQALIDLGFYTTGGASPLSLNGGSLTASGGSNSLGATTLTGALTLSTQNVVTDTTTGTKIGTGATQKLGFFNATPIVQPASTTDLRVALINLGLYATGGASPLDLNGGALTAGTTLLSGTLGGSGVPFGWKAATVTPGSDANVTLSAAEYSSPVISLATGSWLSGHNLVMPNAVGWWQIRNNTPYTATVIASGTSVAIATGASAIVRCNGVDIVRITDDSTGAIPANVFLKDSDQTLSEGVDITVGTVTGTKIGTGSTQKLGFFGSTPVVQPGSTTDLRQALIDLGLYTTGGATPLDLNGGTLLAAAVQAGTVLTSGTVTAGDLNVSGLTQITVTDAITAGASDVLSLTHNSSGTPAANFGSDVEWYLESTTLTRSAATHTVRWVDATDATRKARMTLSLWDTLPRECLRMEASGSAATIGFLGASAVVRPTSTTDLRQALIDLGLYTTGGASPLNLNGGALTASGTNSLGATTLTGALTLSTQNLVTDTTTGTKIGTGATQKIGFFNATPIVQPSAYTQTYATADKTHAAMTSADLTGISTSTTGSALAEPGAAYAQAVQQQNFRRIQDQFVLLRADVLDLKQLVNSVIDDLQALGLAA